MTQAARIVLLSTLVNIVAGGPALAQMPQQFSGITAYYSKDYQGRTASGAVYDPEKFTAAHRTLPFGTRLRVTDKRSGRSVEVVVNDRGPFNKGRVLDLSLAAAKELRMTGRGLIKITAEVQPDDGLKTVSGASPAR